MSKSKYGNHKVDNITEEKKHVNISSTMCWLISQVVKKYPNCRAAFLHQSAIRQPFYSEK
jgi:hypothetical protein